MKSIKKNIIQSTVNTINTESRYNNQESNHIITVIELSKNTFLKDILDDIITKHNNAWKKLAEL